MIMIRFGAALTVALLASGCSIAPRVDDVGVLDAYEVGDRLRCEMRDAIRGYAVEYVRRYDERLADGLEKGRVSFAEAYKTCNPIVKRMFNKYDGVTVGYAFTFDIKENNDTGGGAGVNRSFSRGSDTIGLTATLNRQRRNIRTYRLQDEFDDLATNLSNERCPYLKNSVNFLYPIFGDLGLIKFVGAFLDANQSQKLIGPPDHPDVPTMSENLQFTTKVGASVNPGFALTAVGRAFELASANVKFEENREDSHQVIITLALPPEQKLPKIIRSARVRGAIVESQERAQEIQNSQYLRDFSQGPSFR